MYIYLSIILPCKIYQYDKRDMEVIRASNFRGMGKHIQKIETLIFILKIFRSEGL